MFTSTLVPCYPLGQIKCCVNTHVALGLRLSRTSSTSCGLSVTPAPTCSCCASAWLVPPPSKTFLKSGSQRSGDTPPPRRSSLSARSATCEKMSRWKRRILPNTHICTLYIYIYLFQTLKTSFSRDLKLTKQILRHKTPAGGLPHLIACSGVRARCNALHVLPCSCRSSSTWPSTGSDPWTPQMRRTVRWRSALWPTWNAPRWPKRI